MINARHRFHGRNSLKKTYSNGVTVRGPYASLKFGERKDDRMYRVAVVVSRKVHKSAVTRNRIRRRIYEIVRQSDGQARAGKDLIFTVFSEQAATIEHDKLKNAIEGLLQKAASRPLDNQTPVGHAIVDKRKKLREKQ